VLRLCETHVLHSHAQRAVGAAHRAWRTRLVALAVAKAVALTVELEVALLVALALALLVALGVTYPTRGIGARARGQMKSVACRNES
jgi:hypothetical protein